jgi:hypothetical protein
MPWVLACPTIHLDISQYFPWSRSFNTHNLYFWMFSYACHDQLYKEISKLQLLKRHDGGWSVCPDFPASSNILETKSNKKSRTSWVLFRQSASSISHANEISSPRFQRGYGQKKVLSRFYFPLGLSSWTVRGDIRRSHLDNCLHYLFNDPDSMTRNSSVHIYY